MTLTSKPLAVLVLAIMFGGIFFSSAMGWWQTESTKEAAVFTSGEHAGQANPADIRGSYTFGDVEKNFGVPATVLAEAFGVQTSDPSAFQVKSLEEMYAASPEEVGTSSVRLFVAFYLGLPFDLGADIYLPEPAAALLREHNLNREQAAYLEAHTILNPNVQPESGGGEIAPQPTLPAPIPTDQPVERNESDSGDLLVKGKTTFAELLEWGVSKDAIEQVLGEPMPAASGMKVKDFCNEKGLSFETIRPALQAVVDQVK